MNRSGSNARIAASAPPPALFGPALRVVFLASLACWSVMASEPLAAPVPVQDAPSLTWDHYYNQDEVTAALKLLRKTYPDLTELRSLGKSAEGRDIWQLTINNPKTGPDVSKPGVYADGAIHGNEIQATEVCLYLAWQLLTKYGQWERITGLVDSCAFYLVPTVNVDNRARFFEDPGSYNVGRSARLPHDDDHDGLLDEDDYEDIDGDGQILQMRVRDTFGDYKSDPDDPRVMVRIKPGEKGEWTRLGAEGIDNDGDGRVNEDPPGYLDLNRNWGFLWQPYYVQSGAGDFPFSAENTKAISDFIITKPNICFAFNFHNFGGMYLRGPGSDLTPPILPSDLKVFDYLGQEGERVVPGYRYLISSEDLYTTHGDFDEFMYQCLGIYAFVGELYMSSEASYVGRSDKDAAGPDGTLWSRQPTFAERQKFNDRLMMGEMFEPWHTFAHPTYGEIEIGGWRQFTTRMPPPFLLPDLLHRNAMFVIWTATQAPRIELEITEVKKLGDDLWRVRALAGNRGAMPTLSAQVRNRKIARLDQFTISGGGIEVLAGGVLEDRYFDKVAPVEHHPERVATFVPGFGKQEVQWIVAGKGKISVAYDGLKCGRRLVESELR
jgi:hypothetical protein